MKYSGLPPEDWYRKRKVGLQEVLKKASQDMQQYAQSHASSPQGTKVHVDDVDGRMRWIDRSIQARKNLTGYFEETETTMTAGIGQGVEYGPSLEIDHDGKYAICEHTLRHAEPQINQNIIAVMNYKGK